MKGADGRHRRGEHFTLVNREIGSIFPATPQGRVNPASNAENRSMPAGRPSDYTTELAVEICRRMAEGQSARAIGRSDDMPATSTIYLWLAQHSEFSELYARAARDRAHLLAEEALEIADDGRNDTQVDDEGRVTVNYDHIQRSKLRVDTRKWFAAKLAPRVYGDKQEVTHSVADPLAELMKALHGQPQRPIPTGG